MGGVFELINRRSVIICDYNTASHCLPILLPELHIVPLVITIPAGEDSKSLAQCSSIIQQLIYHNIDRDALIVNLGGGVVSDIGAFVASIYKRGVEYINIPTSLLGMVDASIGGKTGVDFDGIKNVIGTFHSPTEVITRYEFLETLPEKELLSGFAEMLKYGLIADNTLFETLIRHGYNEVSIDEIYCCQNIKKRLVERDPFDKNERKALNFGHTFGHAFESLSIERQQPITHGHAVALGLLCELYLSNKVLNYPQYKVDKYKHCMRTIYHTFEISINDNERIIRFMLNDKKNSHNEINCVLLNAQQRCVTDFKLSKDMVIETLNTLKELSNV